MGRQWGNPVTGTPHLERRPRPPKRRPGHPQRRPRLPKRRPRPPKRHHRPPKRRPGHPKRHPRPPKRRPRPQSRRPRRPSEYWGSSSDSSLPGSSSRSAFLFSLSLAASGPSLPFLGRARASTPKRLAPSALYHVLGLRSGSSLYPSPESRPQGVVLKSSPLSWSGPNDTPETDQGGERPEPKRVERLSYVRYQWTH